MSSKRLQTVQVIWHHGVHEAGKAYWEGADESQKLASKQLGLSLLFLLIGSVMNSLSAFYEFDGNPNRLVPVEKIK